MRDLHADLLSKLSTDVQPAMRFIFTSQDGGTTYDYSFDPTVTTNRSESLMFRLEPFDEYAEITLRNDDLAVPSLVGYWVDIGIGANTDSGLRYGILPRFWVKEQHTLSGGSKEGKKDLKVLLQLGGVWNICREEFVLIGSSSRPFYNDPFSELTGRTIYGIFKYLIETTLYSITGSVFQFTLDALGTQDDGVIDSLVPEPVKDPEWPLINQDAPTRHDRFIDLFERWLAYTGCYLRAKEGLAFKIIYPQSTDAVNETYYSSLSDGHVFYENTADEFLKRPNRVKVFSDISVDKDWSSFVEGEAFSDDWTNNVFTGEYVPILEIEIFSRGEITDSATADTMAAFKLNKHSAQTFGGRVIVPLDPRVELYDRVLINETRGSA